MRLFLFLLPLLALQGCAAAHLYRDGLDLAQEGRPYDAAGLYLDALDANGDHRKAKEALHAIAAEAYTARLGEARAAEDARSWADARAKYLELRVFSERLAARGAGFDTLDLDARIAAVDAGAAGDAYTRGEAAFAAKEYAAAVGAWREAAAAVAGYRDTGTRIADTLYAWAEADKAGRKWRSAAGRYLEARDAGHAEGTAHAAAIYHALGHHFMWTGHCRQAVRDLRRAVELVADRGADDVAVAEACAATPIVVLPFENPTAAVPAGLALSDAAADELSADLRAGATAFVQLLEREALDRILAEQKITTTGASAASRLPRAHWLVIGKFTQVRVGVPPITPVRREVTGRRACPPPPVESATPSAAPPPACVPEMNLRYDVYEGRGEVRLAGSVRVVDARTGVQAALWPFDVVRALDVRYADTLRDADGRAVEVVPDGAAGGGAGGEARWQVPAEVIALRDAPRGLPDESVLLRDALDAVVTDAATRTLALLDTEAPAEDPAELKLGD